MIALQPHQMSMIADWYADSDETLILSCLQGYMGKAWVDALPEPKSAIVVTGDLCFPAGVPSVCILTEMAAVFADRQLFVVPGTPQWEAPIEQVYAGRFDRFMRYAIRKEPGVFNREKLQAYVDALPVGYSLCRIGSEEYQLVLQNPWSRDFVSLYADEADYLANGLGWVVLHDGEIVSGASSYSSYRGGIEIQIDTRFDHRRKGLARVCGARLILDCLDHGLYPSWDAANRESVALSEQLGYHFSHEYVTYAVPSEVETT